MPSWFRKRDRPLNRDFPSRIVSELSAAVEIFGCGGVQPAVLRSASAESSRNSRLLWLANDTDAVFQEIAAS